MNKTKEIKRILMGRLMVNENGVMQMRPKHVYASINGVSEGFFSVLIFGVMSRTRTYHCEENRTKTQKYVEDYMQEMGRQLKLEDNLGAIACLIGYPAMVLGIFAVEFLNQEKIADEKGNSAGKNKKGTDICVTFCTGRTPFGILRSIMQFHRLEKKFGDLFQRTKILYRKSE